MDQHAYNQHVAQLCSDVLRFGEAVEQALQGAMDSLQTGDTAAAMYVLQQHAQHISTRDQVQRLLRSTIDMHQPGRIDEARFLHAVSSVSTELGRLGDYACSIADYVLQHPTGCQQLAYLPDMERMIQLVRRMLHTSLAAFAHQDAELARSLAPLEDEVDGLEESLHDELCTSETDSSTRVERITNLPGLVHMLERVADRANNIGVRVLELCIEPE